MKKPFQVIREKSSSIIPNEKIDKIPSKWEKIGDVLVIVLDEDLYPYEKEIGEIYAEVLNCKSVLKDIGGIKGELRKPDFEIIYGSNNTETVHKENNVKYKIDPRKIMFSSGNMDERIRMSNISKPDEIIVDMFAGIGYFSLPIAVHSKPKKIFSVEKNPESYEYLCENIILNNVSEVITAIKGDNREVSPKNIADRVIMGYIGGTKKYLETCFECLKDHKGFIHFHEKNPTEDIPDRYFEIIKSFAEKYNKNAKLLNCIHVKSYAPKIGHYVLDVKVE